MLNLRLFLSVVLRIPTAHDSCVIIAGKYKRKRFDSWPKSRLIFDPFRVYMLPSLGKTVVSHFDRPNGDAYGA